MLLFDNGRFKKCEWVQKYHLPKMVSVDTGEKDEEGNPIFNVEEQLMELVDHVSDKAWYEEIRLRVNNVKPEEIVYEPFVLTEVQKQRLDAFNSFDGLIEYDVIQLIWYMFEYDGDVLVGSMQELKELMVPPSE